jgi:hypothetical protein
MKEKDKHSVCETRKEDMKNASKFFVWKPKKGYTSSETQV